MRLYSSTVVNRIDGKGRVSVPAAFRKVLDQEEIPGVVIIPGLEGEPALDGMGHSLLADYAAAIEERDSLDEVDYALRVGILGEARQLHFDDGGRIVLPPDLRESAGLTGDEALFIGLGRTFQIWHPPAFAARREQLRALAQEHRGAVKLGLARRRNGGGA